MQHFARIVDMPILFSHACMQERPDGWAPVKLHWEELVGLIAALLERSEMHRNLFYIQVNPKAV